MLVRQQEPYPQSAPPAVVGKMVQIPYVTVPLYAALLIALGWFGGEQWRNKPEPQPMRQPVAHAALVPLNQPAVKTAVTAVKAEPEMKAEPEIAIDEDTLPPLRYSAHVYASLAEKRSIVLNGQSGRRATRRCRTWLLSRFSRISPYLASTVKRLPSRRWMTGRAGRLRRVRRLNKIVRAE